MPGALGEGHFTLGEGFAKCRTRRRALGEDLVGEAIFAECQISGTWRSLRQVPKSHLAKMTASGFSVLFAQWDFGTRRRLRRVPATSHEALGEEMALFFFKFFAECHVAGTRRSPWLLRPLRPVGLWHSAKPLSPRLLRFPVPA